MQFRQSTHAFTIYQHGQLWVPGDSFGETPDNLSYCGVLDVIVGRSVELSSVPVTQSIHLLETGGIRLISLMKPNEPT